MKVLYIGYLKESSGWGQAARDWLLALDSTNMDVVARSVPMNFSNYELPDKIKELESKSSKGCDIVIQHLLPHHMTYDGHFAKNIGLFVSETSHFGNSSWAERLSLMDEIWVTNNQMINACKASYVEFSVPIKVLPHATNIEKFSRSYEGFTLPDHLKDKFVFYFIGEFNRRKNVAALLKAFHLEFDPNESVGLLLKSGIPGVPSSEASDTIVGTCHDIKRVLKLYPKVEYYNPEIVITDRLSEDQLCALHIACDCYVGPSFGEAWNIPAFNAMGFGKTPICTDFGGPSEYINCHNEQYGGWLVPGTMEPVFGMLDTFQDLYVGNEEWCQISVAKLRQVMRQVYKNKRERELRSKNGINTAYNFSYENVGKTMEKYINER